MNRSAGEPGSAFILGVIVILLGMVAYIWGGYYWRSRQDVVEVECRRNLLELATALELYHAAKGSFQVDSLGVLQGFTEEPLHFACPQDGKPYLYKASRDSYRFTCPNGHGEIINGRVPWRRLE